MAHSSPLSVLPLRPLPAAVAAPHLTLSQIRRIDIQPGPVQILQDPAPGSGRELAALLKQFEFNGHPSHLFCLNEIGPEQLTDWLAALADGPTGLRLSLGCLIDRQPLPSLGMPHRGGAISQIQWRLTGSLPPLQYFKAFSNVGIWNHLVFDDRAASRKNCATAARTPNIIHSWETGGSQRSTRPLAGGYGQVPNLPGRPLWQAVTDPHLRFLLVDRLTKDRMIRMRVDDDGDRIVCIGENLDYRFVRPAQLPEGYLNIICEMIAAGGSVAATHVRANLQRAFLIGYVEDNGVLVANSSLKNPRAAYIENVRRQSGLDLNGYVERGYTSVRPEYRGMGIGTRLLEGLTRRAGQRKVFSVISEENTATQTIARRNRTRKVATYYSQKAGKPVGIWMPEGTIDNDFS